jgi:outer membrane lipopolysaccharide assembly protein LptE/RlpB
LRSPKFSSAPRIPQAQPAPQARTKRLSLAVCAVALILVLSSCGYHVSGTAPALPAEWKSIAIPAFKNDTTQYRIEQRFTSAVIRQFLERTKYRIIQNPEDADAILHGEVVSLETSPVLFNATTGQVTSMVVTIHTRVSLVEIKTQKVVYHNDDVVFRDEYQISTDVQSFFQEEGPAVERMARDFAAQLVSNVTENF